MKPLVALVGGFLGAGKTTLILKAAQVLRARGVVPAAVLNDQGSELVDTHFVRSRGVPSDEVTGGCFCCRFPELVEALERVSAHRPDVIFAEAVGSCTDLVATTLRPLLREYGAIYRFAPFSVLVHEQPDDPELRFLFDRQLEEADLVIRRDVDVEGWLDSLMGAGWLPGVRSISVDYERYAKAEAALGWLNGRATVRPNPPLSPSMIVGPLLDELDGAFTQAGVRIVHLKAIGQCESGYVKASVTANGQEPTVKGVLDASPAGEHELLINLRALGAPDLLRTIVENAFAGLACSECSVQSFRPAAPEPYHRS